MFAGVFASARIAGLGYSTTRARDAARQSSKKRAREIVFPLHATCSRTAPTRQSLALEPRQFGFFSRPSGIALLRFTLAGSHGGRQDTRAQDLGSRSLGPASS